MRIKRKKSSKKPYILNVRFDPDHASLIKDAAARRRISINQFICLAVAGTARKVLEADLAPSPLPEEFMSADYAA
jgi:uncharacterized protein (DUF1778 family)